MDGKAIQEIQESRKRDHISLKIVVLMIKPWGYAKMIGAYKHDQVIKHE